MKLPHTLAKVLLLSAFAFSLPVAAEPVAPAPALVTEDVSSSDFSTTLSKLKKQLAADGWNVVAEINLGARLAKKNVAIPGGLVILELTSGKNAVPLLQKDSTRWVSALMPCSVSIYGMSDGRVMVSRMNAAMMSGMMQADVAEIMKKSAMALDESIARALAK